MATKPAAGSYRVFRNLVAALCLCLAIAACATPFPPELNEAEPEPVAAVLADAYQQVSETYLYEAQVSKIALAGLSSLSRVYDGLEVKPDGDTVSVAVAEEQIFRFNRPAEGDVDGWAAQVAAAMIAIANRPLASQVAATRLYNAHMEGIAEALGPDVAYLSDEVFWNWLRTLPTGVININYRREDAGLRVLKLDRAGQLAAEGLRLNDIITEVDGAEVRTLQWFKLFQKLVGQKGTKTTLSLLRGDPPQPLSASVTYREPEQEALKHERDGSVAIFALPLLNERLSEAFWKAMRNDFREAKFAKKPLTALLIDLRGTWGTDVDDAVGFAENFLGAGVTLTERGRSPSSEYVWRASLRNDSEGLPTIVLIDGMSGPNAEVVAAGLQDNGRAIVIGSSTYGAGVRYKTVSLSAKGNYSRLGILSMPATRLYAPSGYSFEGRGVLPDICIADGQRTVEGWLAALRQGDGLSDLADRTRHVDPDDEAALAAQRALCPLEPDPLTFDPTTPPAQTDLAQRLALAILNDPALYKRLLRPSPGLPH
ncbi:MAG: S41 family peptidase [Kiloniellaceae bacterium]